MGRRKSRRCWRRRISRPAPRLWWRSPRSSSPRPATKARRRYSEFLRSIPGRASSGERWRNRMNDTPRDRHAVDPKLLEILVCPLTKGPLEYDAEKQELISRSAKLAYPIRDGIPIMLPEEARALE